MDNETPIEIFHLLATFYGLSITTGTVLGVCECAGGGHSAAAQRSLLYPVFVKGFSS